MVVVRMADQNDIDPAELGQILVLQGRFRVRCKPRIGDDHLPGRRRDLEHRLPEPKDFNLSRLCQRLASRRYGDAYDANRIDECSLEHGPCSLANALMSA